MHSLCAFLLGDKCVHPQSLFETSAVGYTYAVEDLFLKRSRLHVSRAQTSTDPLAGGDASSQQLWVQVFTFQTEISRGNTGKKNLSFSAFNTAKKDTFNDDGY